MAGEVTRLWTDRTVDLAALGLLYVLEDFASELGVVEVPRHLADTMGPSKRETDRALAWLAERGLVKCEGTCVRICGRMAIAHAKARARADAAARAAASRWGNASASRPHSDAFGSSMQVGEITSQNTDADASLVRARGSLSLSDLKRNTQSESLEGGVGETFSSKPKRGTRLPEGWNPKPETVAALEAEGIPNPGRFLAKFRDHWAAAAGKSAIKVEWDATFRNWCRRELEYAGVPTAGGAATVARDVQNTPEAMRSRIARVV